MDNKNLKKIYPNSIFVSGYKEIDLHLILDKIKSIMNEGNVSKILNIPYNKTYILDQIYSYFQILKREDNEDNIKLNIFGDKRKIAKIVAQIKK